MTLNQLFDLSLRERRDETGLEWQGRSFTFGEIGARAGRMANALRKRGFQAGDRLAVQLSNCVEFIDLYLACLRLGVIFVPVNVLYREREVSHILHDAAPPLFVTQANLAELMAEAGAASDDCDAAVLEGDSPAALVYTSGTTGAAKGAILTHNNFAANAVNLLACWQITAADRFLLALPLFHVHALGNGLHCWLLSGCRMRLLERFEHQRAANEFLDFRPSLFFGVPTIYTRLLETPPETARAIGQSMRLFVSGSAPLPPRVMESFRTLFGHTILERYGMTETLMNISNPYAGERRQGSIGFPLPGISVRLLDGEIYLKGPNVFAGYWQKEEATKAAFRDGWFRTGDLASVSPDGYYTLCGRRSDLIICGGFNIYPREIEEFLMEQPEVAEAAVAGVPDAIKGEVPVAWIVARGAFDPAALEARCRRELASFKLPRAFVPVDALPRNALGKVQKHLLRAANEKLTNWAGNLSYSTQHLHEAASVAQLQTLVRSQDKVKMLGTRHCFNSIADSRYNLLSLKPMNEVVALDPAARTVTVDAGITYGQLCPYLDGKGFALHNLASLPHISIAGAISTATHGSGEKNGNLATAVSGLEIVTAAGDVVKLSRQADGEVFRGAVTGLGALGAITRITLDIQPTYAVRQYVYEDMPLSQMKDHFDAIQSSGYSVSLFTDWQKQRIKEVWIKSRVGDGQPFAAPPEFFGAKLASRNLHPIAELSAENCTEQMGVPGPWYERLPHFRMGFTPSAGKELQSEYFVARQNAIDAILAVERLRDQVTPHLLISEIRTIAADDLWMSTCYGRPSVTIHFTWKPDGPAVRRVLPVIEKELSPFQPRPHWGKLFTLAPADLRSKYERLGEFVALAAKYDPKGKFRNDFLNTYVLSRVS